MATITNLVNDAKIPKWQEHSILSNAMFYFRLESRFGHLLFLRVAYLFRVYNPPDKNAHSYNLFGEWQPLLRPASHATDGHMYLL